MFQHRLTELKMQKATAETAMPRKKCCLLLHMETGWEETEDNVVIQMKENSIWPQNYPHQ